MITRIPSRPRRTLGYPLLVMVTALVPTALAIWADEHIVGDAAEHCRSSPGVPGYAVAAAIAGLLAGVAATLWLAWQLVTRRAHPLALPLLLIWVLPLLLQGLAVNVSLDDSGYRRDPCEGLAAPLTPGR
ncbi:hypothetical protein OG455_14805 [Kitasatospora sp. NBC_01287]|uniref:hypothetical protein n=1 Tax=Kitasatospora sp. NBC_01287 TaxID=2903573 RepID=UPI00225A2D17|nr:hypothetical protein [Kitasatospora sp. NBC_01287]MCX4746775.1 hypothetical protein [Kitasatospora sp. NBC_01287]